MDNRPVKLGLIGLGPRGQYLIDTLTAMEELEIAVICDRDSGFFDNILKMFDDKGKKRPDICTDYQEILEKSDIEGVIIATNWITHKEIAIAAMKAGKYAGVEVGGAASLEECWQLVKISEETGVPCMMLENCCFGKNELMVLNMARKGLFGEIVHCECGYAHDLRQEMMELSKNRLLNNMHRSGDLYPTHGLGTMAKLLNINRGNRFVSITSMASKAVGFNTWIKKNIGNDHSLADYRFVEGDVVQSMIKCAHGETVLVTHNISLPRPYSRYNVVQGSLGIYMADKSSAHFEGITEMHEWDPVEKYYDKYMHPLWKEYENDGVKGGHGGMDYLVMASFAESIRNKTQTTIDVYDTAIWMAITVLSEQSIALGSMPVAFPDFTNGKWINREPAVKSKYALNDVYEDKF